MNNRTEVSGGIGFFGLLTIVFIVLKLTKVISWGWQWVLAPIWIPFVIGVVIIVVPMIIIQIFEWGDKK